MLLRLLVLVLVVVDEGTSLLTVTVSQNIFSPRIEEGFLQELKKAIFF